MKISCTKSLTKVNLIPYTASGKDPTMQTRLAWLSENTDWYYIIPSRIDWFATFSYAAYIHEDDAVMFKLTFAN